MFAITFSKALCPVLLAVGAFSVAAQAQAQPDWPSKTVVFVSPFPPGGTNDVLARVLAERLTRTLGQRVVVDNRPGAGGNVGNAYVAKAEPDGHTLLMGSASIVINPSLYRDIPYQLYKELTPLAVVAIVPNAITVHPSVPVVTLAELLAYAKGNPGRLAFGSGGAGQVGHLAGELLKVRAGVDLLHVPYRGAAPAVADHIAGRVQVMFENVPVVLPHVRSGSLRALAVTHDARVSSLPSVPTAAEAGLRDYTATAWQSVWIASRTPERIQSRLSAELLQIVADPDMQERIRSYGAIPSQIGLAAADTFTRAEFRKWADVVKASGARVD